MTDFRDDFSVCHLVLYGMQHVLGFFSGSFPVACDNLYNYVASIYVGIEFFKAKTDRVNSLYCYVRQHGCF